MLIVTELVNCSNKINFCRSLRWSGLGIFVCLRWRLVDFHCMFACSTDSNCARLLHSMYWFSTWQTSPDLTCDVWSWSWCHFNQSERECPLSDACSVDSDRWTHRGQIRKSFSGLLPSQLWNAWNQTAHRRSVEIHRKPILFLSAFLTFIIMKPNGIPACEGMPQRHASLIYNLRVYVTEWSLCVGYVLGIVKTLKNALRYSWNTCFGPYRRNRLEIATRRMNCIQCTYKIQIQHSNTWDTATTASLAPT